MFWIDPKTGNRYKRLIFQQASGLRRRHGADDSGEDIPCWFQPKALFPFLLSLPRRDVSS